MTEIEIRNFQSIKKVNFSIEGFTVIVGKNNIGKSAIIRAVEAALTNKTGKDYIRKGEKQTEIKIKKDALDIKWKKGVSAVYEINKEPYKKLNRDVPKPLIEAGYDKIEMGKSKVFPLVASQFKPLFLIDEHGTVITEVLASLYNIDTLSVADELCQKSLRSNKSLLKTREKDLKILQEKLEKFKDFENIKKTVESLLEDEKKVLTLENEIADMAMYEKRTQELAASLEKLKPIKKIKIPDISKHEKNFSEIQEIQTLEDRFSVLSTTTEKLKAIIDINLPSLEEAQILSAETVQLYHWDAAFTVYKKDVKQKRDVLKELEKINYIETLNEMKIWADETLALEKLEEEFNELVISAKKTRDELRIVTEEYDKKYAVLSKEICPTCKRPYGN